MPPKAYDPLRQESGVLRGFSSYLDDGRDYESSLYKSSLGKTLAYPDVDIPSISLDPVGGTQKNISLLQSSSEALREKKIEALSRLADPTDTSMSTGNVIGEIALSALPIALGYALGGNRAAFGASQYAGARIGQEMEDIDREELKRELERKAVAQQYDTAIAGNEKQQFELLKDEINNQQEIERGQRSLANQLAVAQTYAQNKGARGEGQQEVATDFAQFLGKVGDGHTPTEEEMAKFGTTKENLTTIEKYRNLGRKAEWQDFQREGGVQQNLSDLSTEKIERGLTSKYRIQPVINQVKEFEDSIGGSYSKGFTRSALANIPGADQKLESIKESLQYFALDIGATMQGRALSDLDRQAIEGFISGVRPMARGEISLRLERMAKIAQLEASIALANKEAQPKTRDAAKSIREKWGDLYLSPEQARTELESMYSSASKNPQDFAGDKKSKFIQDLTNALRR